MRVRTLERSAIVLVPVLALLTVAVALRAGAPSRIRGARVYAASQGRGRSGLSLQLVTLAEEGGVAEVVDMPSIELRALVHGHEAEWRGASNSEGVAETWLDLPTLPAGAEVALTVKTADGVTLAAGTVAVPSAEAPAAMAGSEVPPMRKTGDLVLDVFVYGGKLVPGSATTVVVRVRDRTGGRGVDGVAVSAEPEAGVAIDTPFGATAGGGWSTARVTAEFLTASWKVSAMSAGSPGRVGGWYGRLPISPGAATVALPPTFEPDAPHHISLTVPPATPRLYVEVIDTAGWDFGAGLDIARADVGRADVVLPPLRAGVYWLVTSSDAHGAESLTETTVARPFRVGPGTGETPPTIVLALLSPPHLMRVLALDGLVAPRRRAARTQRRALVLALCALAMAMVLEALLVLRAAGRTQSRLWAVSEAVESEGLGALEGRAERTGAGIRVVVLLSVTLLGFALVAVLLLGRWG